MENTNQRLMKILELLREHTSDMTPPMVLSLIQFYGKDPYLILMSCLLSLRSKDSATWPVCKQLFKRAKTPEQLLALPVTELEKIIYSIGFYKNKARTLRAVSKEILDRFSGKVPDTEEELLSLPGVGRKTANLVLARAFDKPAICVDVHVHRISNRLGIVSTKTPEETELALQKIVPVEAWSSINDLLVMWGQNICVPVSPYCSKCALFDLCERVGVTKSR
jgi:endonuclease-3